jgi:hypothetical protein
MHKARVFGALAVLADGDVLAAGGYNGKELAGAEVFDPSTGVWTKVAAMPAARSGVSAVTLNDGAVLVFGDDNNGFIYNPAKNTWTQTGGSSAPFSLVSLVKLPDGSVLVLGGITQHGTVSVAEVYDPTTGKWSSAGTTSQARIGSAAVVLSNGQVLVAGGNRMGLTGLKSQVTSFATDTSAELFSLVPTRVPPFGTPPPRSTPPPGSTPHPGSTVPSTSTGEPWASFAYWLVVGLGGVSASQPSRSRGGAGGGSPTDLTVRPETFRHHPSTLTSCQGCKITASNDKQWPCGVLRDRRPALASSDRWRLRQ